jgi:HEAT repeat protein
LSEGLKTTLNVLAETRNEAAVQVLVPALDSPHAGIREASFRTILGRRSPSGHREVIARLHRLDDQTRSVVGDHPHGMTQTLRDAVLSGDPQFCENGCRAAVWFREYDLVPALITALEDPTNPNTDLAGATLLELVELLYGELASPEERSRWRDPQVVRQRMVAALEQSVRRYGRHKRREVVDGLVLLAKRDNAVLCQVLKDPHHAAFVTLVDVLSTNTAGGVIRLLLSFLDDPHAPSVVLSVVAKRCDVQSVRHLLRKVGREPSRVVRKNLRQITSVGWIRERIELLDDLDESCQHAAIRLVMASGIPQANAFAAVKHMLSRGKSAGRRAAAKALEAFQGAAANDLALWALNDDDPQVQANILVQLRGRGIPGALPRLLDRIESPHAVVRAAVRESLSEFSFTRFLAAFEMLDEEVRHSTGTLVKKLDPETIPLLEAEMESPIRTHRLRALAVAETIEAVEELESGIIKMLEDEDHMVRARAAAAMAQCASQTSYDALAEAIHDRSPVVQEAARKSLEARDG